MAIYLQLGIPKEKGNTHSIGTRLIKPIESAGDFEAGTFVTQGDVDDSLVGETIKPMTRLNQVPVGVIIKVDATNESASVCKAGRLVPVKCATGVSISAGDVVEVDADGRVKPADGTGTVVGIARSSNNITAYDQNGTATEDGRAVLIDFGL